MADSLFRRIHYQYPLVRLWYKQRYKLVKLNSLENQMVEARGVEPLSGTPSAMASTRLAGGLGFRRDWARLRRCLS